MRRLRTSVMALPLVALVLLAAPVTAIAQTPAKEQAAPAPTLLLNGNVRGVRSDSTTSRQLAIEVLDVQVRIRGGVAETRMTATFRNDSADVLEGDFLFDMPAGSVITGYALDVGGDLIDGVLAGRDQAREAYQRRVVQRIDPGLAEVTWSDRFSTRILPIPARGSRTIRLAMTSPVDAAQGYVLPMRPAGRVGRFTLGIEADDGTPPNVVLPTGVTGTWAEGRFTLDRWDARLGGELRLTQSTDYGLRLSRHASGDTFFELKLPGQRGGAIAGAAPPRPTHVFWDRSASRADDRLADETALLLALLEQTSGGSFFVTLFDSGATETFSIASTADLRRRLSSVRYAGATSFAGLGAVPVEAGATCVVISDGRATIDSRAGFALPCRTFTIASDREVDRGWLSAVADRSGGVFAELGSATVAEVVASIHRPGFAVGRLVDDEGRPVDTIVVVGRGGQRQLIGRMPDRGGLRRMTGDRELAYPRPAIAPPLFSGTGALWASRTIAADAGDMRTSDLVALSRRYSVASPMVSFIVLEQPADYVEANIPPPGSYPKPLFDQYAILRTNADRQIAARQEGRLNQVASMWDNTQRWWASKFEPRALSRPRSGAARDEDFDDNGSNIIVTGSRRDSEDMPPLPTPPPPPPPPPPPMVAPPVPVPGAAEDLIVSGTAVAAPSMDSVSPISVIGAEEIGLAEDQAGQAASQSSDIVMRGAPDNGRIDSVDWSPGRPWIVAIDAAGANWADEAERQRVRYGALPLFWFDLAEWHWQKNRPAEARRAVESALDLETRDNQTLEIVAGRLVRYGDLDRALALYAQVADREDERPQPQRQRALVLMARAEAHRAAGRQAEARTDLEVAIALLADAVLTVRREEFRGFETLALMDANLAVQRYRALGGRAHALPERLVAMLDTDIRIVVEWNTPRTDLDLWVAQPDGERVGFSNDLSQLGGRLTGDVTNGFGPEEFMIRRAARGTYTIEIDSFASDRTNPNGPSTVQARIIRNFGLATQSEELVDIEMDPTDDGMRRVGTIDVR